MKNKILSGLLIFFLMFSLVGCGNTDDKEKESKKEKEEKVEEVSKEKGKTIDIGETIATDDFEFVVEKINITNKVMPPMATGYYSYYEADEGKMYVDVVFSYKNLQNSDAEADEVVDGILKYKSSYEYDGFAVIEEENRSDFTYANITSIAPLTTEYLHYLFEVPSDVVNGKDKVVVILTFGKYKYNFEVNNENSGNKPSNEPVVSQSKLVQAGETQVVDGIAEFYVEKATITNKVIPPKASGYYSYYEADAGKVYVDVIFSYKNLQNSDVEADEIIGGSLKYDNKYDYSGFSIIEEDNRSDFTYSSITSVSPLTTEYIHILYEIPAELQNDTKPIQINFMIGGSSFTYNVR